MISCQRMDQSDKVRDILFLYFIRISMFQRYPSHYIVKSLWLGKVPEKSQRELIRLFYLWLYLPGPGEIRKDQYSNMWLICDILSLTLTPHYLAHRFLSSVKIFKILDHIRNPVIDSHPRLLSCGWDITFYNHRKL